MVAVGAATLRERARFTILKERRTRRRARRRRTLETGAAFPTCAASAGDARPRIGGTT